MHLHLTTLKIPEAIQKGTTIVAPQSFISHLEARSPKNHYTFLPIESPWIERKKVVRDYALLKNLHQINLGKILKQLKSININNKFDDHFFETIISPWLFIILMNYSIKSQYIHNALVQFPIKSFSILENPDLYLAYKDDEDYVSNLRFNENWNFAIYTVLLEANDNLSETRREICKEETYSVSELPMKANLLSNLAHKISLKIAKTLGVKVLFYASHFDRLSLLRLQILLKQPPLFLSKFQFHARNEIDQRNSLRNNLKVVGFDDNRALTQIIKATFPLYAIENFERYLKHAHYLNNLIKPQVIITATAMWYDTVFKFYVAYARHLNPDTKLLVIQHGGSHGVTYPGQADLEQKFGDYYLTWGFTEKRKSNNIRFCNPKKTAQIRQSKTRNKITLVRSYSPIHPQMLTAEIDTDYTYFKDSIQLVENISDVVLRNQLILRLYPSKRAFNSAVPIVNQEKSFWEKNFSYVKIDDTSDIIGMYEQSTLVIYTYMQGTGYVECLSNNIPVIIISRHFDSIIRSNFRSIADEMKRLNIVFTDPVKAAAHINEVYDDVERWWLSPDVQSIVKLFNSTYVNNPKNRISSQSKLIKSLIKC